MSNSILYISRTGALSSQSLRTSMYGRFYRFGSMGRTGWQSDHLMRKYSINLSSSPSSRLWKTPSPSIRQAKHLVHFNAHLGNGACHLHAQLLTCAFKIFLAIFRKADIEVFASTIFDTVVYPYFFQTMYR